MTRIKYSKFGNTLMTDYLTVGPNHIIRGLINEDLSYGIITFDCVCLASGQASNLRNAKIMVRRLLLRYGAKLNVEIRNKVLR